MAKKICIISPAAYPILTGSDEPRSGGGAEAQLCVLGRGLAEEGYEVHYIVDDFGQPQDQKLGDVYIHKAPLRYMGGNNLYLFPDWLNYLSVLSRVDADYHVIKLPRNLLVPLGVFCKIRNRRLIFIGQIDNDVDLRFIRENEGVVTYWLYRIGMKAVDFIVAQNERQREGFERLFRKRTRMVKSIITLPTVGEIKKKNYVLWVGSALEKKKPLTFIELARAMPDICFKMAVAPVDEELDNRLRAEACKLPNLEYLGFVPLAKISRYFSEAALFVSTSIREGFPNTFLQSWQFGTPVVSLSVDPDDLIQNNALGRLSRTFEQLCSDVDEIMNNPELRREFGENGRNYVYANHSKDVIIPQYLNILKCL